MYLVFQKKIMYLKHKYVFKSYNNRLSISSIGIDIFVNVRRREFECAEA